MTYMRTTDLNNLTCRNFRKWDYFSIHDIDEVVIPTDHYSIGSFLYYAERTYRMFDQIYISQHLFVSKNQPAKVVNCDRTFGKKMKGKKIKMKRRRHKRQDENVEISFLNQFNRYKRGILHWKHIFRYSVRLKTLIHNGQRTNVTLYVASHGAIVKRGGHGNVAEVPMNKAIIEHIR